MSAHDFCRFCKKNLFINGNYQNTKKIFDRKTSVNEKSTYHRLKELGLPLCLDRSRSFRMCRGCFRSLGKMEYYFALFKSWLEGERDKGVEVPAPCEEKRLSCEPDGEHEFEESTPQCPSPPTPTHSPERILADNLASVAEYPAEDTCKTLPKTTPVRTVGCQTHILKAKTPCRSKATQVRTSSRDCGVGTVTFPLDSPLLLLQPTAAKRPTKRPQPGLSDREGGPSKRRSSAVALKTEDSGFSRGELTSSESWKHTSG